LANSTNDPTTISTSISSGDDLPLLAGDLALLIFALTQKRQAFMERSFLFFMATSANIFGLNQANKCYNIFFIIQYI
jgi:hypothetical protein